MAYVTWICRSLSAGALTLAGFAASGLVPMKLALIATVVGTIAGNMARSPVVGQSGSGTTPPSPPPPPA